MKRIGLVKNTIFVVWLISCAVFMMPGSLEAAPEITYTDLYIDNFGPNPFGWAEGLSVQYGGNIQDSTYPIDHVTATYLPPPASSLTWSEYITFDGDFYWGSRLPENFSGLGLGQSWGSVQITATNTQGESTTAVTRELYNPLMIPLASNIQFSDMGITPTITWDAVYFDHDLNAGTPEVPVDCYHIRIYHGDTHAEVFRTYSGQAFIDPTFQIPPGVLSPGTNYWVRILSMDIEQDDGTWFLMNRSSTWASFNTSLAYTAVNKGSSVNQYNPDLLDIWVLSESERPAVVGTPFQGDFEFHPAAMYPCNHATFSGTYTSNPESFQSTATVLEKRYVSSGTVQGIPNTTIVGSTVEYVIQEGPAQAAGVTIRRSDWEVNGRTGSTFSYFRFDPDLGTPYFHGHAEGDINGILCLVGNDGMGHAITETRRTSIEGVQDTSVSTIVWDNPVIYVVESEVVHTGVPIYTRSGIQFEYTKSDECIDDGDNVTQYTGESFYLPDFNVGHFRSTWQVIGADDYGVFFNYNYIRTDSTDIVPRVIGLLSASAQNLITSNGFTVGSILTAFSDVYPAGRVISQSVTAGNLATLGSAIDLVVSNGPDICECDLNSDGSCNVFDWFMFIEDWGRTDCAGDCECDLNGDGSCNVFDWFLFIEDWGRTDCPVQ
jgi:hypothetical protein